MTRHSLTRHLATLFLAIPLVLHAQQTTRDSTTASADMIDRIFEAREFTPRPEPQPHWVEGGDAYVVVEPGEGSRQTRVVKYDSATGAQRDVVMTAAQITPPGASAPLAIEELSWSTDGQRVLVFTNGHKVWRTNARGDFWLVDLRAGTLKKIGGDAPEASLMYARFSPDATKVAYIRQNDIYVEDIATGDTARVTRDGSDLVINGAADWVNEEELGLHDCYRWSPDGSRIAFWQFDTHDVGNFPLMYYLGKEREVVTRVPYPQTGPYPFAMSVPYPLAGTTNSAVRAGVADAKGGGVTWMQLPGDPREHYIARLQWADPRTVLVQQLNRLQNTDDYLLADAATGAAHQMWRDHDDAFITIGAGDARRIREGAEFLVSTEKDGWKHVYRVARDGHETARHPRRHRRCGAHRRR